MYSRAKRKLPRDCITGFCVATAWCLYSPLVSGFHVRSPLRNHQSLGRWSVKNPQLDWRLYNDKSNLESSKVAPSDAVTNVTTTLPPISSDDLIEGAEQALQEYEEEQNAQLEKEDDADDSSWVSSRRLFVASALVGAGVAAVSTVSNNLGSESKPSSTANLGALQWETTPINRRTGITVFDAEKEGYNVSFVTYLARFLLCFDTDCQRWWYTKASDIPRFSSAEQVEAIRLQQFAAFSASVEIGLQEYSGKDGPGELLDSLIARYCPNIDAIKQSKEGEGQQPKPQDAAKKEAKRQIALLFGLLDKNQPVEKITKLLAAIDNGSIASIELKNAGSGYAPGYGAPAVVFPEPEAGEGYTTAKGRALLRQNGKLLRVDVMNRGSGYNKPPTVIVSEPALLRFGNGTNAATATAKAILFKSGVNKGMIERIQLIDPGAGYAESEIIRVKISPPESDSGVAATAAAIREYEVSEIRIVDGGSGYAVEKPIEVYVEPPPLTARVNMNDPLTAQVISPNEPLPLRTIPAKDIAAKMPNSKDPSSVSAKVGVLASNGGKGGGGGCIGRACYDTPVQAIAYPRAEKDSFSSIIGNDPSKVQNQDGRTEVSTDDYQFQQQEKRVVSGSGGGPATSVPLLGFYGTTESSAQLLSLLPAGVGLEYRADKGRYILGVAPEMRSKMPGWFDGSSSRPLNPDFGPRGRSPIEQNMKLGVSTYLRFIASGAICCSLVHLSLTPIDVVKTKVQVDPVKYPSVGKAFMDTLEKEGVSSFFTGWAPTLVGYMLWGGVGYSLTEFFRRYFTELAGAEAMALEVPIVILAAGIAASVGSVVICPFEAVRIRSVAQKDYAPNIIGVLTRMVKEEGPGSLFNAIPVFLGKEVPFAMAKFSVFDISTAFMYTQFPAAREDLQLSLGVSLLGGTMGGIIASIVSNPADATISEMKKSSTKMGPIEAGNGLIERGGIPALFTGLPLRMVFYSLMVSLQFFIYDAVRFAFGIGSDDLKLYLDVLGGALKQTGST